MISTCAAAGPFKSCNIKLEKAEESGRTRGLSTCKALGSDIFRRRRRRSSCCYRKEMEMQEKQAAACQKLQHINRCCQLAGGEEGSVIKTCVIAKFKEKPQWEMIQTQAELCRRPALTSKQEEEPVGAQKKGWTKNQASHSTQNRERTQTIIRHHKATFSCTSKKKTLRVLGTPQE